jgi:hypothetical protein
MVGEIQVDAVFLVRDADVDRTIQGIELGAASSRSRIDLIVAESMAPAVRS